MHPGARPSLSDLTAIVSGLERDDRPGSLSPADALSRLPSTYFTTYDLPTTARHIELICSLSREEPYALEARRIDSGPEHHIQLELTVVTVDAPGMLSLLAGSLGAAGFDITSGDVFTLARDDGAGHQVSGRRSGRYRSRRAVSASQPLSARRIVDRFVGTVAPGTRTDSFFTAFTGELDRIIPLIALEDRPEEARRLVNEAVAERLRASDPEGRGPTAEGIYPLEIRFESGDRGITRMTVTGEDTPFFLYSLSAALNLQNISIESVAIETREHVIADTFELVDRRGTRLDDQRRLDQIRLSVLLTKQFTYFIDRAPDPYSALVRFESISRELADESQETDLTGLLTSPGVLGELAQVLGASDFLWEDFIRLQYENIIPLLSESGPLSHGRDELERIVDERIDSLSTSGEGIEPRVEALNEFKDREAFLVDLEHILHPDRDFFFLSNRLSDLAEIVVDRALALAWESSAERYGEPLGVADLPAEWAVFGLGKLGGRAIGYASDIELMLVYRDSGTTSGPERISNAEFFERFFMEATGFIRARREGIFSVDLRLRPHGKGGPHAVSLESFNRYYGRDGDAHSYERLALTRLRAIAGSGRFGREVELLRDELVYASESIKLDELRDLRERQAREKLEPGRLNAKFSPGGLVDLEYGLQILLVSEGRTNDRLRTQSLHAGLEEFERTGFMDREETGRLVRAYRFLRNLINGLRMLRGNAADLFLPDIDSLEYSHLARRLGYRTEGEISASEQLHVEFEARTASVRAFLERHLGRGSIPGKPTGNAADLVLSEVLPDELTQEILARAGLKKGERAMANLRGLAGSGEARELFSELIILAWQALRTNIDPDMALNNWERFVRELPDRVPHFRHLLRQPRMLELMLQVFATSNFLADTLIRQPESLGWALDREIVTRVRTEAEIARDLREIGLGAADAERRMRVIRRRRRQELLRIGARDICLQEPLQTVTLELAALASAIIQVDLEAIWGELGATPDEQNRFTLLAFGKQGGRELNYSSDIDLLGLWDDRTEGDSAPPSRERVAEIYDRALTQMRADLSSHTADGYAYRLDFRLRPFGTAGPLVPSFSSAVDYYTNRASDWEHQALIKVSPLAGNQGLGTEFLKTVRPASIRSFSGGTVRSTISRLRAQAVRQIGERDDVKNGEGGIRDIEFIVQGLQMIHAADNASVLTGNTLLGITRLMAAGFLPADSGDQLAHDYERLRRVEHLLQMHEDRQVHEVPRSEEEQQALARRLDGKSATAREFMEDLRRRRERTRELFLCFVNGKPIETGKTTDSRTDG